MAPWAPHLTCRTAPGDHLRIHPLRPRILDRRLARQDLGVHERAVAGSVPGGRLDEASEKGVRHTNIVTQPRAHAGVIFPLPETNADGLGDWAPLRKRAAE